MKQVIVITGATGGIGQMLCQHLLKPGRHIVCVGRQKAKLEQLLQTLRPNAIFNRTDTTETDLSYQIGDMTNAEDVQRIAKLIIKQHGSIDLWINNVGVNRHEAMGPTWRVSPQNWFTEVQDNLFSAYLGSHAAIDAMLDQNKGYVVNLGGGGADTPKPYGSAYGCAKAAIVKFTETLNEELLAEGLPLRAFCFNPGFIRNQRTETLVESDVAQRYMPNLKSVMEAGKMSNIEDSVALLEVILTGQIDHLGGSYFMSDSFADECLTNSSTKRLLRRSKVN